MIDLAKELSQAYILREDGNDRHVDICLPPTFTFFAGHFPQRPVLPAVGIIDVSHFLSGLARHKIHQIQRLKVKKPVQSGEKLKVLIQQEGFACTALWTDSTNSTLAELKFSVRESTANR